MRFHHMAIMVSDLPEAIHLWRDVLGFELLVERTLPDGVAPGPKVLMHSTLLDDIFKVKGARSNMAWLKSPEGAMIELQECENPPIQRTPPENLRYAHTGIHELGLAVDDITFWFDKIRAAGYETQTDYIWWCGSFARSFLFYDRDGNMIQVWQDVPRSGGTSKPDVGHPEMRT